MPKERALVAVVTSIALIAMLGLPSTSLAQGLNMRVEVLEGQVADLEATVAALEQSLAEQGAALQAALDLLESRVSMLESSPLGDLAGFVYLDEGDPGHPKVVFDSVNVQIVDGTGATLSTVPNGLGNLIVGYDESAGSMVVCSQGPELTQVDCEAAGKTWGSAQKTGNHNLVVGPRHSYTRSGGVVFGLNNAVIEELSTVSAGMSNVAAGTVTSVHGGNDNAAAQNFSTVSGGFLNTIPFTSGNGASVISGGSYNTMLAGEAAIGGGSGCTLPASADLGWGAKTDTAGDLGDC